MRRHILLLSAALAIAASSSSIAAPAVLQLGDQRLRLECSNCDLNDPGLQSIEQELHAALEVFRATNGYGRAISAPQIGHPIRMIACNLGSSTKHRPGEQPFTLINPKIVWRSEETFSMWDDCMSFPEKMVRLRRHKSISLTYLSRDGKIHEWDRLGQAEAELLQHEIDHLSGILAVDHAELTIPRNEYLARKEDMDAQVDYRIGSTIDFSS